MFSLTSSVYLDLDHGRCNMAFVATCRSKHSHVVCQFSLFYLSPASCLETMHHLDIRACCLVQTEPTPTMGVCLARLTVTRG